MESNHKYEWDYLGWKELNSETNLYTQTVWNRTLMTKVNQASNYIHNDTSIGHGNQLHMHPKTFVLLKSLEFYDENTNMLGSRYKIIINDNLPQNKLYVKFVSPFSSKLDDNHILVIKTSSDFNRINLTILKIDSEQYEEVKKDSNYIILTDKLCTAEISILNNFSVDPVTGEILIDYHMEISQDIWIPSPRQEELIADSMILKSSVRDTPKMKFKIPVGNLSKSEQKSLLTKIKEMLNIK